MRTPSKRAASDSGTSRGSDEWIAVVVATAGESFWGHDAPWFGYQGCVPLKRCDDRPWCSPQTIEAVLTKGRLVRPEPDSCMGLCNRVIAANYMVPKSRYKTKSGARRGSRTPMPLRAGDFESPVSADSTIRAQRFDCITTRISRSRFLQR